MARTHSSIATDSEEALRSVVGPDATAGFEADPKFDDTDPAATASSSNVAIQRDTDDTEDSEEEEIEATEDEAEEDDEFENDEEEDEAEEDDDEGDVDYGLDEDDDDGEEDDDLDTDQITDAALGLNADLEPLVRMASAIRMAPATSVRTASRI